MLLRTPLPLLLPVLTEGAAAFAGGAAAAAGWGAGCGAIWELPGDASEDAADSSDPGVPAAAVCTMRASSAAAVSGTGAAAEMHLLVGHWVRRSTGSPSCVLSSWPVALTPLVTLTSTPPEGTWQRRMNGMNR